MIENDKTHEVKDNKGDGGRNNIFRSETILMPIKFATNAIDVEAWIIALAFFLLERP